MAGRRHSRQPPARRGIRERWPITSPGRGGRSIAHGVSRGLQAQPTQAAPAGAKERLGRAASHVTIGLPRHELLSPLPGLRAARPKDPRLAPWATALSPRLGLDDDAVASSQERTRGAGRRAASGTHAEFGGMPFPALGLRAPWVRLALHSSPTIYPIYAVVKEPGRRTRTAHALRLLL